MRRRGPARSAIVVLVFAFCVPALAAAAQSQGVRVDARVGFGGLVRRNAAAPLTVLVESDSFLAGTVQVVMDGPSSIERPIELPGGSRKELIFVVPSPSIAQVRILDRAGRTLAERRPTINDIRNEALVGVLASIPPPVTRTTVSPLGRDATVVAVGTEIVELGDGALDALSHLVVDAKTVAGLSPRLRETVLGFATEGELVVAASSESDLAFLPSAWRGGGGGDLRRVDVASGHITVALRPLSDPAWSAGGPMWSQAIRPADLSRWAGNAGSPSDDWLEAITASGGFRAPSIGWLLAFVIGYVVLVGPLNFFVLSRLRRRELAWITVPVLALLFASGAYAAGRGARNVAVLHGAGIVVVDDAFRRDSLALAVLSRGGGEQTVKLDGSWLVQPVPFQGLKSELPAVRTGRDESEVRFPLAVGAVGTLTARRITLASSPDAGVLAASGGAFEGTVRNPLDIPLRNAGVFVGSSFSGIGSMDPGAQTVASVSDGTAESRSGVPIEFALEEQFFRFGNPQDAGAFFALIRRAGATAGLGAPGRAFLIGFADFEDVGRSAGLGPVSGTVLVVAPVRLDVAPSHELSTQIIPREVVAHDGSFEPGGSAIFDTREVVLRFDLPSGRSAKSVTLNTQQSGPIGRGGVIVKPVPPGIGPDVAASGGAIELSLYDFAGRGWRAMDTENGLVSLSGAGAAPFLSPAGELYVRLSSEFPQYIPIGSFGLSAELA